MQVRDWLLTASKGGGGDSIHVALLLTSPRYEPNVAAARCAAAALVSASVRGEVALTLSKPNACVLDRTAVVGLAFLAPLSGPTLNALDEQARTRAGRGDDWLGVSADAPDALAAAARALSAAGVSVLDGCARLPLADRALQGDPPSLANLTHGLRGATATELASPLENSEPPSLLSTTGHAQAAAAAAAARDASGDGLDGGYVGYASAESEGAAALLSTCPPLGLPRASSVRAPAGARGLAVVANSCAPDVATLRNWLALPEVVQVVLPHAAALVAATVADARVELVEAWGDASGAVRTDAVLLAPCSLRLASSFARLHPLPRASAAAAAAPTPALALALDPAITIAIATANATANAAATYNANATTNVTANANATAAATYNANATAAAAADSGSREASSSATSAGWYYAGSDDSPACWRAERGAAGALLTLTVQLLQLELRARLSPLAPPSWAGGGATGAREQVERWAHVASLAGLPRRPLAWDGLEDGCAHARVVAGAVAGAGADAAGELSEWVDAQAERAVAAVAVELLERHGAVGGAELPGPEPGAVQAAADARARAAWLAAISPAPVELAAAWWTPALAARAGSMGLAFPAALRAAGLALPAGVAWAALGTSASSLAGPANASVVAASVAAGRCAAIAPVGRLCARASVALVQPPLPLAAGSPRRQAPLARATGAAQRAAASVEDGAVHVDTLWWAAARELLAVRLASSRLLLVHHPRFALLAARRDARGEPLLVSGRAEPGTSARALQAALLARLQVGERFAPLACALAPTRAAAHECAERGGWLANATEPPQLRAAAAAEAAAFAGVLPAGDPRACTTARVILEARGEPPAAISAVEAVLRRTTALVAAEYAHLAALERSLPAEAHGALLALTAADSVLYEQLLAREWQTDRQISECTVY
ncbi:hypothetical protein T492DRAFT_278353 [Pavlovales sp. CCMP2436]|nr:hypothetical protein T492DRAFT_278353 [Pavlovales sp. CCMP2436]